MRRKRRSRQTRTAMYSRLRIGIGLLFRWLVVLGLGIMVVGGLSWLVLSRPGEWVAPEPYHLLSISQDGTEIVMLSLLTDRESVVITPIPADVTISYREGQYRVGGLLRLGELENAGAFHLRHGLQEAMGVRFSRVVWIEQALDEEKPKEWLRRLSWSLLAHGTDAALFQWRDDYQAWWRLIRVSEHEIELVDLEESGAVVEVDRDGLRELSFNPLKLEEQLRDSITPQHEDFSQMGVVVVNTTEVPGLADRWSRRVIVNGFDLLGVSSGEGVVQESELVFASETVRDSVGGQFLQFVFEGFAVSVGDVSAYRSDAVVRLGWDVVK